MKWIYKIGRLFLVSDKLTSCFDPFLLDNLQYDETTELFSDMEGNRAEKPAAFHTDKNVLFIDYVFGEPDLEHAEKSSTEKSITIWHVENGWVYSSNYGDGWLQITPDYRHATYYMGKLGPEKGFSTFPAPVLMAVQCSMIMQGYLIVHAACIENEGQAVLFSGPSGVGKSTRAKCWIEANDASLISGDRPVIDPVRGRALGAPWDGVERIFRNIELPIASLNCIRRAEQTKLTRMTTEEKKNFLATQTFVPMWDPMLVTKTFAGIKQLIGHVNIWSLACDQTAKAAKECHDILFPKEAQNIIELMRQLKAMDTPETEYKTAIDNFMEFKARRLGIPFYGTFELTPLCNLDCKMCYVHLQKQQMENCGLMTPGQWKSFIRDAHDAGMKFARVTGGECLTYPGFDEVYLYLQELGVEVTVLTNGLLLNEERIAFFLKHPPRLIQVTLYGNNDDVYERVTGVRGFERVYHNILAAKEANLPIVLAITPNAFAYPDLPEIIKLAEETGISYNINPILTNPRENTGRERHDLTDEQYVEIYRLKAQMHSEHLQPPDPAEIQEPSTEGKRIVGIKCGAGRSNFAITWDGRMIPCTMFSDVYQAVPGKNFLETWKAVNRWAEELPLPSECSTCSYQDQCIQCIGIQYDSKRPGHCDKDICRREKLFAETGLIRL